jgi:hypothetical protein
MLTTRTYAVLRAVAVIFNLALLATYVAGLFQVFQRGALSHSGYAVALVVVIASPLLNIFLLLTKPSRK